MKDYGPKNPKDRKQALFPNYFDPSPTENSMIILPINLYLRLKN